jgi:hypothetical protein
VVEGADVDEEGLRVTLKAGQSDSSAGPHELARALVEGGFRITRLEEERGNLETAFMELTRGLVQ